MKNGYQPRTKNCLRTEDDKLINDYREVMDTWKKYDNNTYTTTITMQTAQALDVLPNYEEVQ